MTPHFLSPGVSQSTASKSTKRVSGQSWGTMQEVWNKDHYATGRRHHQAIDIPSAYLALRLYKFLALRKPQSYSIPTVSFQFILQHSASISNVVLHPYGPSALYPIAWKEKIQWLVANRLSGNVRQGLGVPRTLRRMRCKFPLSSRATGFVTMARVSGSNLFTSALPV